MYLFEIGSERVKRELEILQVISCHRNQDVLQFGGTRQEFYEIDPSKIQANTRSGRQVTQKTHSGWKSITWAHTEWPKCKVLPKDVVRNYTCD